MTSYQKRKAESKVKDQIIESLKRELLDAKNRELDAKNQADKFKDQIIESKDETIGALRRENAFLTEEKSRDEEKEHSKFCLGSE